MANKSAMSLKYNILSANACSVLLRKQHTKPIKLLEYILMNSLFSK